MTDAEKELRRMAVECIRRGTPGPWPADLRALHVAMPPSVVLALLDRIEALEHDKADLIEAAEKTTERLEEYTRQIKVVTLRGDFP
jgi:hypothetical protein